MALLRDQSFSISHTRLAQGPMNAGCCCGLAAGVWALSRAANNRNAGRTWLFILPSVVGMPVRIAAIPPFGAPLCRRSPILPNAVFANYEVIGSKTDLSFVRVGDDI